MMLKCYVQNGVVINMGEWVYQYSEDEEGNRTLINPIPEDAVFADFDVSLTKDGRYVLSSNYYELREAEYPDVRDQLDAIWKGGTAMDDMRAAVMAVKDRYPKP